MVKRVLLSAYLLLAFAGAAFAQSGQLGAGQVWGNSSAAQRPGQPTNLSPLIDQAIGSTRGSILERGASGWALTTPGTSGLPYVSAGAGNDPAYNAVTSITGVGTLTAGATGAGFTINLGTSTVSGILPAANGGAGTINGLLRANGSGLVSTSAVQNAELANSSVTIGSTSVSLGGTLAAATGRGANGLNVESIHTTGDAIVTIATATRVEASTTALTASRAWTLPAANAVNPGQSVIISDAAGAINGANTIVVTRTGADTINGGTTFTMGTQYQQATFISDGTSKWTTNAAAASSGASLSANNVFTGENTFQNSIAVGQSAPAPSTDFHLYNNARPVFTRWERDQNLSIGGFISQNFSWGKNASGTSGKWAFYSTGVDDCLWKYSVSGSGSAVTCFANENTAGNEEGAHYFYAANGFGTLDYVAKVDENGITMNGTRNVMIQNGQGIVWLDSFRTPTYGISMNAQHIDIQSCNAITSATCGASTNSIRLLTNAIGSGGLGMEIIGDGTIKINYLGGGAGTTKICLDASSRLTTTACP